MAPPPPRAQHHAGHQLPDKKSAQERGSPPPSLHGALEDEVL